MDKETKARLQELRDELGKEMVELETTEDYIDRNDTVIYIGLIKNKIANLYKEWSMKLKQTRLNESSKSQLI